MRLAYSQKYTYATQDEDDEVAGADLKWVQITFSATFMTKESYLLSDDLEVQLIAAEGQELSDTHEIVLNEDPESGHKCQAELQLINQSIFDLIQKLQMHDTPRE